MATSLRYDSGLRYLRVANSLREQILEGVYQPGARLPRQHDLAKENGVSFGTLKVALDLLEREGYLLRKVGQGTFAALPEERTPVALVVDDDSRFCSFLSEALKTCGWDSVTATSGQMALETLHEKSFNLVLLDLGLPRMDGAQAFREIRKIDQDVPVVIVTGYPDSGIMSEALKVGPFPIVGKPFHLDQLSHLLSRLIGASPLATTRGSSRGAESDVHMVGRVAS